MPARNSGQPQVLSDMVFHHTGFATTSIDHELAFFTRVGYTQEGNFFTDPVQGVRGVFIVGGGPRIELLENLPGKSTLTPWLSAGVRLYHHAYFIDDISSGLIWTAEQGGKVLVPPVQSVAFDGRKICFVRFRHGVMLEFIERQSSKDLAA